MIVVDSSGWMHYFMNGDLAEAYSGYINKPENIATPTIISYEVYKKIKTEFSEEEAYMAMAQMQKTKLVPLSESLAYHAADISIEHKLPMADAIIYSTAAYLNATLVTSDADFKGLPKVTFISEKE